jgi:UDP-4-amino-4,6-dideoxy-N-acetyl-beta-L-altrosamine transaminase
MIPYGRQHVTEADIEAVVEVLRSDFLTQGPMVPQFEKTVAEYCGAGYGVAVNSATSALHVACLAMGLGPEDWLWTSPITFVASANCALYCGAKVDFVDIDSRTFNISPEALAAKLEIAEKEDRLPKVVIPVHLCGQSCDMEAIARLSSRYGFRIIEDASHAIGGRYKNEPIGSCQYSDITVFSFHPVKVITTGEGGLAVTNNIEFAERMAQLRSHGITRDPRLMTHAPDGPWYYQQIELGFNYRMTDLQAALGLSQFARLDSYVSRRHELAQRYNDFLSQTEIATQESQSDCYSSLHLYVVRLPVEQLELTHLEIFKALRQHDIGVNVHYIPVHLQPYYTQAGFHRGQFPESESYYNQAISLPIFPTMTNNQVDYVAEQLLKITNTAGEL